MYIKHYLLYCTETRRRRHRVGVTMIFNYVRAPIEITVDDDTKPFPVAALYTFRKREEKKKEAKAFPLRRRDT